VLAAIDAGAGGYLLKDGGVDAIREHPACLRNGGSPQSPRIARTLVRRVRRALPEVGSDSQDEVLAGLVSQRELDVPVGIGKGFSDAEVAARLGTSMNTVRTHVRRIHQKRSADSAWLRSRSARGRLCTAPGAGAATGRTTARS
jgi:DNA-binding NarL/FixJ family response regulator